MSKLEMRIERLEFQMMLFEMRIAATVLKRGWENHHCFHKGEWTPEQIDELAEECGWKRGAPKPPCAD